MKILHIEDVKPYINSVPFLDLYAAAGNFSDFQGNIFKEECDWVELPMNFSARKGYFVCKVKGESMNMKIENGSLCLFEKDYGGSREGKIVLIQNRNIQDNDFGTGLTIKEYHSKKIVTEEGWKHSSIILKPKSFDSSYKSIVLEDEEIVDLKVIGIFITVLD